MADQGGGWNYRVVKRTHTILGTDGTTDTDDVYSIHECYYRKDGTPGSVTMESAEPHGATLDELRADYDRMAAAFTKPVLNYEDF